MIDSRKSGEHIMHIAPAKQVTRAPSTDTIVHTGAVADPDRQITEGNVLWTLSHGRCTAQARRWNTPSGFELEVQIWTGPHVAGNEDLCWTQLFGSEAALEEAADAKKRQLQASGWLEDINTSGILR